MRRLSAIDFSARIAAAVCVLVFAVCFLSLRWLPRRLARERLEEKAELLLHLIGDAIETGRNDLLSLPSFEYLNCNSRTSDVLARRTFENTYVRWFLVVKEGDIVCASGGDLYLTPVSPVQTQNEMWSVQIVRAPNGKAYYSAILRRGDLQYAEIFDPLLAEFQMSTECPNCVSYSVSIKRVPLLTIRHGTAWNDAVLNLRVDRDVSMTPITLQLAATQAFVDRFKSSGWLFATGISALVALTFSYMLYGFLVRRTSIGNLIRQGINQGEFVPYYQPIVDARDGSLLGAEALVRWRHKGELIAVGQFIDYAEETGLIGPVTEQILNKVLRDLKTMGWVGTERYISINAVPDQITDGAFCEKLVARLAEEGIPGKNLAVEITERRKLKDLEKGKQRLACLEAAGIDIKIDDAGTGFGGFSYVQELPVGTLKIDKMFVDTLRAEGDAKRQVLDAIIQFAHMSGLRTIAEGVETREQVEYLVRSGVYAIQGYVFAPPMPVNELMRWIEAGAAQRENREVLHRVQI